MFCPNGYVTIHECQQVFRDIARERWEKERPEFRKIMKTTRHEIQRETEAYDEGVTCDYVEEWEKPEITKENWEIASYFPAFRRWATTFLVVRNVDDLWACSPQGQIIQPSHDLFHTVGDFRISFSLNSEGFADLEENQARFTFLEESDFTIKSVESLPSYVPKSKRRQLQPFAGWSICWKPKSFDNWQQELREIIADTADGRALDVEAMKRQPTLADERKVAEQIVAFFDADNQVTKGFCRQKATPRLGTNAFNRAWSKATELQPALALAGRRTKKSPPPKPAH